MAVLSATTESGANAAVTLTIAMGNGKSRIFLRSLTVTTRAADIATDVEVDVKDDGTELWSLSLRAGQLFGAHVEFPKNGPVIARAGDMTVVAGAGGAAVLVKISCTYEIL
jgi:hypothetical protein